MEQEVIICIFCGQEIKEKYTELRNISDNKFLGYCHIECFPKYLQTKVEE